MTTGNQMSKRNSNKRNQYQIRPMSYFDLDEVMEIEQSTWGNESWKRDDFLRGHSDSYSYLWILEDITDRIPSISGYGIQEMSDNTSHITNLTIHPSQCGRGLGGILLRHMIDHARQVHALSIILEVNTTNMRACKLYTNHGFQIIQVLPKHYSEFSDAYRMRLIL